MSLRSRRQFLEDSMFATAAALAASSKSAFAADEEKQSTSPNEKLGVAVVGVNGRGTSHLGAFSERKDTEVLYVVDPDERVGQRRVEETAKRQGRRPQWVADMRKAFADPAVNIVSTATPNHWHALTSIWAMQAGKDVYVEKPVSHNVSEGRRMVETARKHKRICQTGTQSRSSRGMREAMAFLHEGQIGKVTLARGLCYKRRGSIGAKGEYAVPEHIDIDLWTGPAPLAKLTRPNLHYDWHWQWPYGNGDLGNQGIHQMDLARWGLGVTELSQGIVSYGGRLGYEDAGETANTQVVIHDFGDKSLVFEVRGLETGDYKGAHVGNIFEAADGYVVMTSYEGGTAFDKAGNPIKQFGGGGDHFDNFVKAVRSRQHEDLHADILDGHLSSALCHLGNVSYRLGSAISASDARGRLTSIKTTDNAIETFDRTLEHLKINGINIDSLQLQFGAPLTFDPAGEKFVGNGAADAMLTREYRAPFVVPTAGNV